MRDMPSCEERRGKKEKRVHDDRGNENEKGRTEDPHLLVLAFCWTKIAARLAVNIDCVMKMKKIIPILKTLVAGDLVGLVSKSPVSHPRIPNESAEPAR